MEYLHEQLNNTNTFGFTMRVTVAFAFAYVLYGGLETTPGNNIEQNQFHLKSAHLFATVV